jgi:hypothetical protein
MIRMCDRGHASLDAENWRCPWCQLAEARGDALFFKSKLREVAKIIAESPYPAPAQWMQLGALFRRLIRDTEDPTDTGSSDT